MLAIAAVFATSCSDYLDINTNANNPTTVAAPLVLSQALVATGIVLNQYNTYGMQTGGYAANAGGFGGFNETTTYIYTNNNYANLWPTTFDNLEDYQYILNQTVDEDGNVLADQIYFNAVARIMKSYDFQLLIDAYNNVPYSEALQGDANLTPKYDDAPTIYSQLAADLDKAIADIEAGQAAAVAPTALGAYDVVFGGNVSSWIKLANTIKLRLMVRGQGKVTFANTTFNAAGFITTDALINPGYTKDVNRQNPNWNSWAFNYTPTATNVAATKAWIPTTFVFGFYNGYKLNDPGRGAAMYYQFPATGTNQLGYEGTGIPKSPDGNFWYPGADRKGATAGNTTGVLKGSNAGMSLMLAAESYFLQAEASMEGIIAGNPKTLFESGIHASFKYLYQLPDKTVVGTPDADANAYIASNNSYLVKFDNATTDAQKLEAIITQKWLALNMVNSQEGFNEYRRTGYPRVQGTQPNNTFASAESLVSTRPDRLPTRVLYPISEIQYNSENVPTDVNSTTSLIFWAK
jgi:hypothetical protein